MERHRPPAVLPPANRPATLISDHAKPGEVWARANLPAYPTSELERALELIEKLPGATGPFACYNRTAYLKLKAELAAR